MMKPNLYFTPRYQLVPNYTSIVMDQLDTMTVDTVLKYDPAEVQLMFLRRCITRYYNERDFRKGFTLKPAPDAYKIWRWK